MTTAHKIRNLLIITNDTHIYIRMVCTLLWPLLQCRTYYYYYYYYFFIFSSDDVLKKEKEKERE